MKSVRHLMSAETASPAMETMQTRFVPANRALEVSVSGGFDYPVDKVAVEARHLNVVFLDVDSLGCIRLGLVKPEIVVVTDWVKHQRIVAGTFFRNTVMGLGNFEGSFGV